MLTMDVSGVLLCVFVCVLTLDILHSQHLSNDISGGKGPRVVSMAVRSDIVFRFAETVVTSTVVNEMYDAREATFDVSLPQAAFISNFTLEVDGKIYPGIVKERSAAEKTYSKAKFKGQSAGHIAYKPHDTDMFRVNINVKTQSEVTFTQTYKPRDTNKFRVNINVAAQSEVTFTLTYNELLQRTRGHYEHIIYIDPKQIVDQLLVEVYIYESREITALRIPPVRNELYLNQYELSTSNELATVERPSAKTAYIRYNPSPEEQKADSAQGVSGLFKVQYDVQRSLDAGDIYVVNGYFTHFFAPVGLPPLAKRILFVLDVSGSMNYEYKLAQMKQAMTIILGDLSDTDLFNIVTFESVALAWSHNMKLATEENKKTAIAMINDLKAEGGTNVNDALLDALNIQQSNNDLEPTAPMVVFLTDGDPTTGVTNFKTILNNVEENNKQKVQIFSLSFGNDANFGFLKKLSVRNNAMARKIYTDSDASLQMTGFYDEISNVLLSKLSFTYLDDKVNLTSVTNTQFSSFFDGSELIVAGKLNELDDDFNAITMSVVGSGGDGIIELSSSSSVRSASLAETDFKTKLSFETITEKTWAYLTIKKLLQEMLKTENHMLRNEVKMDAMRLALKYNFVTPLTSMVVTKPEQQKLVNKTDINVQEDDANALEGASKDPGTAALTAPSSKPGSKGYPSAGADSDPHFIVNVRGLDYAICFDVMGEEGDIYKLIRDKSSVSGGLIVNGRVVANKNAKNGSAAHSHPGEIKTFLGEISIKRKHLNALVTPTHIRINGEDIDWSSGTRLSQGSTKLVIGNTGNKLVFIFNDKVVLLIMRHLRSPAMLRAGKVNFLGLYIVKHKGLSYHTHGLLGQFLHRSVTLKKTKNIKGKLMGRLRVSGNTRKPRKLMATLGHRLNLATNTTVSCWMVQNNGGALLDGHITDYLIKRKDTEENGETDMELDQK